MKFHLTHIILLPPLSSCRLVRSTPRLSPDPPADPPQVLTSPVAAPAPEPLPASALTPTTLTNAIFVPLQYTGPIHPNGPAITLNGTAQVRPPTTPPPNHTIIPQLNPNHSHPGNPRANPGPQPRLLPRSLPRPLPPLPFPTPPSPQQAPPLVRPPRHRPRQQQSNTEQHPLPSLSPGALQAAGRAARVHAACVHAGRGGVSVQRCERPPSPVFRLGISEGYNVGKGES